MLCALADHVEWISDALTPVVTNVPSSMSIDIRVFVTAGTDQSWDDDSVEGDAENTGVNKIKLKQSLLNSPSVNVRQGRPDVDELIKEEINQASGPISVNVCGTHALARAVRSSLRCPRFMDVLRGGPTVTLHVEAFGNA
ncbi:hypothetical protein BDZ94DRAFT_700132 [Collybia nuda]|uniref:Ferric reductase NAD binding domain-containing protein n=1 Tax=Collybia nuda TaxID=64659 RepID=A0A9P6C838_9AGAR|nr:hypothetical protein BDZ94DRAFT_700132 [Collybia nuda]